MFRKLLVTVCSLALVGGLSSSTAPAAVATALPARVTSFSAVAGPGVGQVTVRWKSGGAHTTSFRLETGLTSFGAGGLPRYGRHAKVFTISRSRRSYTLSSAQLKAAGAQLGSGNHLYLRFYAVDGSLRRAYPGLKAVMPKARPAAGTAVRVGSFNVRTARVTTDHRDWLHRAPDVAREIKASAPGILALQELGPGRADGKKASLNGHIRQTTSLAAALRRVGAGRYRLVRETSYIKPGTAHGTQGTRILYDTHRYSLLSHCTEKTGKSNYNASCAFDLPVKAGDSKRVRRSAAYARFADRRTGQRFWVVSVHLDDRHSGNAAKERSYNALRGRQIATVNSRISRLNTNGDEVIVAGDVNSWQNNRIGNSAHDYLVAHGFYDTASAGSRVNFQYATINHFDHVLKAAGNGYGVRIDLVMVRGARGVRTFKNVAKRVDFSRPSDHNLLISDVVL